MIEQCKDCRFWDEMDSDEPGEVGDCLRFPPQRKPIADDGQAPLPNLWEFPATAGYWRCGEFKRRNEQAAEPVAERKTPVQDSGLTVRTANLLQAAGIAFAEEAQAMQDTALLHLPNFGRKSLKEIRAWKP